MSVVEIKMTDSPKFLHELLSRIIRGETPSEILLPLDPMNKGHCGEAILRLVVMFGINPVDSSKNVIPLIVNPATRRIQRLTNEKIIETIMTGLVNSGGSNKIDVAWITCDGRIAACSSKFGMLCIESIADLEIPAMLTEFTHSGGYTLDGVKILPDNVIPYALVPNTEDILECKRKAKPSNRVSAENLNPIDIGNLNRACSFICEKVSECKSLDLLTAIHHLLESKKQPLRLRFHQRLICLKAIRMTGTILIGALPRSGKTFIGAYLSKECRRILVITTRPSETRESWNSVFYQHHEFEHHHIIKLNSGSTSETARIHAMGESIVAISSLQFLKGDEDSECRKMLEGLEWDIVLLDEIHEGGSTILSDKTLDRFVGDRARRVMLTASYNKPVEYYSIPNTNCIYWDLEDSRLMRSWGSDDVISRLCEKYNEVDIEETRRSLYSDGETDETIRKVYGSAPRLGIMTTVMQKEAYNELYRLTSSDDNAYGFSMRSLFMPTRDGTKFQNQRAVDLFFNLISGGDKMTRFPTGDMSMFARIRKYWNMRSHRSGDEFMTQMWFLPYGVGQTLECVKRCLSDRIEKNRVLRNYTVLMLDSGMDDMVDEVHRTVVDSKAGGKEGVILLTGNVGSLGVSLPDVDVAFLLHEFTSADMTYQQMMRVLTESVGKTCGLVVDFNIWRVLETLNTYASSRCGKGSSSTEEKIRWYISHLVDFDADLIECPESSDRYPTDTLVAELTYQWRKMIENTGKSLSLLARTPCILDEEDQKDLERIAKPSKARKSTRTEIKSNPDQEPLPDGVECVTNPRDETLTDCGTDGGTDGGVEEGDKKTEKLLKANLNEILARIIPEVALLTGETDLMLALEKIMKNPDQQRAMNSFLKQIYS